MNKLFLKSTFQCDRNDSEGVHICGRCRQLGISCEIQSDESDVDASEQNALTGRVVR